ncbi:MAG: hypothetical protein Faunusvirus4_31 [Faunusvirus sp.]|jgi:ankyrin repeat protein|uniref:Uncharacterized protein n=1 Tax=Faunusvirus sp. TaxID=2487766 RepID=A0A3G4ZWG1_9VIRU|nr:MAG: hypothetical protein Faunusvirus4_31 [Faunusvirus sp.]
MTSFFSGFRTQTSDTSATSSSSTASLFDAITWGDRNKVRDILTRNRYEINQTELLFKKTPLHVAIDYGYTAIVELLLTYSPDLKKKDNLGDTPFDTAVKHRQSDIIELLKKAENTLVNGDVTKLKTELTTKTNKLNQLTSDYEHLYELNARLSEKYNKEVQSTGSSRADVVVERSNNKRLREEVDVLTRENDTLRNDNKRLKTVNDTLMNAAKKR